MVTVLVEAGVSEETTLVETMGVGGAAVRIDVTSGMGDAATNVAKRRATVLKVVEKRILSLLFGIKWSQVDEDKPTSSRGARRCGQCPTKISKCLQEDLQRSRWMVRCGEATKSKEGGKGKATRALYERRM